MGILHVFYILDSSRILSHTTNLDRLPPWNYDTNEKRHGQLISQGSHALSDLFIIFGLIIIPR